MRSGSIIQNKKAVDFNNFDFNTLPGTTSSNPFPDIPVNEDPAASNIMTRQMSKNSGSSFGMTKNLSFLKNNSLVPPLPLKMNNGKEPSGLNLNFLAELNNKFSIKQRKDKDSLNNGGKDQLSKFPSGLMFSGGQRNGNSGILRNMDFIRESCIFAEKKVDAETVAAKPVTRS